jgi:hypothetical protein
VQQVGEAIDHRQAADLQAQQRLVLHHARHDRVHVAGEDVAGVLDRLAAPELQVADGEEEGVAAELGHPSLERDARAEGDLLED